MENNHFNSLEEAALALSKVQESRNWGAAIKDMYHTSQAQLERAYCQPCLQMNLRQSLIPFCRPLFQVQGRSWAALERRYGNTRL
jgi:hypothetical protein